MTIWLWLLIGATCYLVLSFVVAFVVGTVLRRVGSAADQVAEDHVLEDPATEPLMRERLAAKQRRRFRRAARKRLKKHRASRQTVGNNHATDRF